MALNELDQDTQDQLDAMGGADECQWFQTFTEPTRIDRGSRDPLAKCHYGRAHRLLHRLRGINSDYGAVCVQIQSLYGRGGGKLKELRFIFLDFDFKDKPHVLPELPMPPTMLIRTPNGWHAYWAITPTRDVKRWRRISNGMCVALGADPSSVKVNKVGRLCGFWHSKGDPVKPTLLSCDKSIVYSLDQFSQFDGGEKEVRSYDERRGKYDGRGHVLSFPLLRAMVKKSCAKIIRAEPGTRYGTINSQAWHLGHFIRYGLNEEFLRDELRGLVIRQANSKWSDILPIVNNYLRLIDDAIANAKEDEADIAIPEEELARWDRQDRQSLLLRRISLSDLPDRVTCKDVMDMFPEWDCFTHRELSLQLSGLLASVGFVGRKTKHGKVYSRIPNSQGSNSQYMGAHCSQLLSTNIGVRHPQVEDGDGESLAGSIEENDDDNYHERQGVPTALHEGREEAAVAPGGLQGDVRDGERLPVPRGMALPQARRG